MHQQNSPPKKPNSEKISWTKLTEVVHNTARIVNAFGWTPETVAEYIRPIMGKCTQGEALNAFRDLFDETGEIPTSKKVMDRVGAKTEREALQGEDIYLYSSAGFCYGPGLVGIIGDAERINGKPTGRMLDRRAFCGCYKCHHKPEEEIEEPEPIDLPGPIDSELEDEIASLAERKKMR